MYICVCVCMYVCMGTCFVQGNGEISGCCLSFQIHEMALHYILHNFSIGVKHAVVPYLLLIL